MSAPRLLQRSTIHMNRPAILLIPRTATPSVSHHRLFSQCRSRLQRHSEQDMQERLQAARPLVPHTAARRFTQAGSSRNSRLTVIATVVAAIGFYFYNSQTVPVTGRRRFNFLSDSMVARAHSKAAAQIIEQVRAQGGHFLSEWDPRTILVRRVMKRLIPVSGMTDLNWEIFVIADSRMLSALRSDCD
jgi:hypothetical protein